MLRPTLWQLRQMLACPVLKEECAAVTLAHKSQRGLEATRPQSTRQCLCQKATTVIDTGGSKSSSVPSFRLWPLPVTPQVGSGSASSGPSKPSCACAPPQFPEGQSVEGSGEAQSASCVCPSHDITAAPLFVKGLLPAAALGMGGHLAIWHTGGPVSLDGHVPFIDGAATPLCRSLTPACTVMHTPEAGHKPYLESPLLAVLHVA